MQYSASENIFQVTIGVNDEIGVLGDRGVRVKCGIKRGKKLKEIPVQQLDNMCN